MITMATNTRLKTANITSGINIDSEDEFDNWDLDGRHYILPNVICDPREDDVTTWYDIHPDHRHLIGTSDDPYYPIYECQYPVSKASEVFDEDDS